MPNPPTPDCTQPDFRAMALITIDMQNDFLRGPFEIDRTSKILPRLSKLAGAFRRAGLPVIHMVRLYKPDGSNADLCRRSAIEKGAALVCPGTSGAELASPLLPSPKTKLDAALLLSGAVQVLAQNEWAVYKPRWGAFYGTPLEKHLSGLGVTSLSFGGCNFPNCPRTSIYEASERDFRIVLVEDAVSGLYNRGRKEMKNIGVVPMTSGQLSKRISKD